MPSADGTEHKRAEEEMRRLREEELELRPQELRDSEVRFSAIFNQAAVGIVLSAPYGRWLRVNQKLCDILGYDESELADFRFQSVAHPDDADSHLDLLARLKAGEIPFYEEEKRLIRKDGSVTWVYITVSLVRDAEGKPDYFVAIIEHIWRRVQTLEALRESEKTKRLILSSAEDSILLLGPDGTVLEANEAAAGRLGATAEELIGKCIYDFMPSEVAAARQAQQPRLERSEVVRFEDEREGTLFENRVYPIFDDSGGLDMFAVFARDVTERKQAEEVLRRGEERYRRLVEVSPHGIHEIDLNGTFTFSNPAHHKILGCAQGEVPGTALWDFVESEPEKEELQRYFNYLVKEQPSPTPYVARIKAKDGRDVVIDVAWNYKRDETGRLEGFTSVVTDVTERTRYEKERDETRFLLHAMVEGATDGIWVKGIDGRYRMWNRSGARILGIDPEESFDKNDFEVFPADVAQKIVVDDREILGSGQERTVEEVHTLNGVERTFETKKGPFHGPDGQVLGLIGVLKDVTERNLIAKELQNSRNELQRKVHERTADLTHTNEALRGEIAERRLAQDALQESESRYRELVELSPDAIFVHAEGEFLFVNSAAVKLFGVTAPGDLIGTNVYDVIHPEYRALAQDRTRRMAASGELPFTELEIRRRDGSTVIVEVIAKRIHYQGRPAILSIHRDISERKQAEAALRESESRLAGILAAAGDGILSVSKRGVIEEANPAAGRMFGYSAKQLCGMSIAGLVPPEDRDQLVRMFSEYRRTHAPKIAGTGPREWRAQKRDGEVFPIEIVVEESRLGTKPGFVAMTACRSCDFWGWV